MTSQTLYEQLGGEAPLRAIVDVFVDRVFDDVMIGFFFRNASRERIKRLEFEHAGSFLGAQLEYTGKPLSEAHGKHRIMGGHFGRRKQIFKEVLEENGAPQVIIDALLEHTESLRIEITADRSGECRG